MALTKAEYERRLKAALALNGMDLADLKEPLREQGLPATAAARAAYESSNVPISKALVRALAEILDVPVAWFEAEDWRKLFATSDGKAPDELEHRLTAAASELVREVQRQLRRESSPPS